MSYLSITIRRQIERRRFNQSDLAREAGLSRGYVSKLLSGEPHDLSEQNFAAILRIFSADKLAQAELVAAHCMDACEGIRDAGIPGADLVEIRLKVAPPGEKRENELPQVHLSQETERAFAWLRSQCPVNPDLEKHVVGYAKLMGMTGGK